MEDKEGTPLIGVSILEFNTDNGTITDIDGNFELEVSDLTSQLVDSSYIKWSITPCPASPTYGSHIWLNTNSIIYPSLPPDLYYFSGFEGQYVMIIPSEDLVILRQGLSKGPPFDIEKVVSEIIRCKE